MDKYTLLIVLNLPFVIFGFIKAFGMFKKGVIKRFGLALRLAFWLMIAMGLLFDRQIYDFLLRHHLTDSAPLTIADVVLVTAVIFCFFLFMRLYTKVDNLERRFDALHEKLSIVLSEKRN